MVLSVSVRRHESAIRDARRYASIAKKMGHRDVAWWAWVPLLDLWLPFKIVGMGIGWFLMTLRQW